MSARQTLLAVLLVGAIVANPLGLALVDDASPTGDAAALPSWAESVSNCTIEDLMTFDSCQIAEYERIEDQQDHLAVYTTGTSITSQSRSFLDLMGNYVGDTEDVGWLIANNETANAYLDGLTKSETKARVVEKVNQYYANKKLNTINAWNNHVATLDSLVNQSDSIGGSTFGTDGQINVVGWYVTGKYTGGNGAIENVDNFQSFETGTKSVDIKGVENSTTVRTLHVTLLSDDGDTEITLIYDPVNGVEQIGEVMYNRVDRDIGSINLRPPSDDYAVRSYYNEGEWKNPYDKIETTRQEIINESDVFIEQTWIDWEQGNINATDIIAQTNAMNRWQVDATDDSATFNDVVNGLAASGLNTPPLNETGYLNLSFEPRSLNGTITADGMLVSTAPPPDGTWKVGKTYDTANLSGAQTVVALGSDGNNEQYQLNQTDGILRVNEVYNRDGEKVQMDTLESDTRDYEVSNTSDAQELIIKLGQQDKEYEKRQQGDGTTGGDPSEPEPNQNGIGEALANAFGDSVRWVLNGLGNLIGMPGLAGGLARSTLAALGIVAVVALWFFKP